jgi:F-type H+-transporting ATPase subunit b
VKQRILSACTFALLSMLSAGTSWASGGGESDNMALVWQGVNLVLLIAVLTYFARKPVMQFFGERRERITNDLDSAAELLRQAELRNSEISRKLVDLGSQVEEIQEATRRRADEECERIIAEAHRSAERIRSDAHGAIEQELARAQRELRREAANLAIEVAAEMLREKISDSDRERLVDEFITRVEPGNERSPSSTNGSGSH